MNNVTFVILGATGDLTKRKLLPAIAKLVQNKKIKNFAILGAARRQTSMQSILKASKKIAKNSHQAWKIMEKRGYYSKLDFYKPEDYNTLKKNLQEVEKKHKLTNRIFYFASLPRNFETITKHFGTHKLAKGKGWSRVVYEKPFGDNLNTAKKINNCIKKVFKEDQVYRIDHYLGKELVSNIALARFTNQILEPLWNNKHIASVQIMLSEALGLESRGDFYDHYGAIKDVVQNHILQVLALTCMEQPKQLSGNSIRDTKANVLKHTKVQDIFLGQYQGFRKEKGVKKDSRTETFALLKLVVNNQRWKGVPFFVKTGKKLNKREMKVVLNFKPTSCLLDACPRETNYCVLKVQPETGITFGFNAKVPGKNEVQPVKMDFCYDCVFGVNTPAAYENLLEQVLQGDQSVFVRSDEIEHAWKVIDPVDRMKKKKKVHVYQEGKKGPKEAVLFEKKHNIRWRV